LCEDVGALLLAFDAGTSLDVSTLPHQEPNLLQEKEVENSKEQDKRNQKENFPHFKKEEKTELQKFLHLAKESFWAKGKFCKYYLILITFLLEVREQQNYYEAEILPKWKAEKIHENKYVAVCKKEVIALDRCKSIAKQIAKKISNENPFLFIQVKFNKQPLHISVSQKW
jgi:hypothetical protein